MTGMKMPGELATAIEDQARRAAPNECCGLLIGSGDTVSDVIPTTNMAADPACRYVIDPAEHFAAIRIARSRGAEVIGAYHSHPLSPPAPSATDRLEAFGSFLFVIIGLAAGAAEIRAWQLEGGNFVQVPFVRT
jgi:proteasome lid subunit RPN8/RPN11